MLQVWVLKVIFLVVIWAVSLVCCLSPLATKWIARKTRDRILSIASAGAGGVFLAGGFIHLMTDDKERWDYLTQDTKYDDLPFTQLCTCIGFLFVFFLEKVAFAGIGRKKMLKVRAPGDSGEVPVPVEGQTEGVELEEITHSSSSSSNDIENPPLPEKKFSSSSSSSGDLATSSVDLIVEHRKPSAKAKEETVVVEEVKKKVEKEQEEEEEEEEHGHHEHGVVPDADASAQMKLMAYFLMFVLSVHSFIAGLALGVQDTTTGTIAIFIAIISHKWVESIALGSSLLRSSSNAVRLAILSLIYTSITPIGIAVGFVSQEILEGFYSNLFNAIVTGISAGTFIYVATIDILTEEFRNGRDRFVKYGATVFGFALTSFVVIAFDTDG